ncbi:MAG: type II toxin-antitoxin system VapC family toxin [Leptospirales bacterium]
MPVKVVDASAIGALLFGEPEAIFVSAALKETKMVSPFLISLEITNICLKKIRRHPEQQETIRNAFQLFFRLDIEKIDVDCSSVLFLAEQSGLTAYDASYVWVAQKLGVDLLTLDKGLGNAFRSIGKRGQE